MEPIREAEMQTQPGKRLNEESKKSWKGYPGGDRTGGQAPGEAADTVGGRRLEICVRRERGHGI